MRLLILFILFSFITVVTINAKNLQLTQEEKNYIDLNVINAAMIPNLYPLKTIDHDKLKIISHDILQLISKKSSISFSYETKTWFTNIDDIVDYSNIPLTILSKEGLERYYKNKRSNSNIFLRGEVKELDIFKVKQYFTSSNDLINLSHDDIDLIISPLLDYQIDILYNKSNLEVLSHIPLKVLTKKTIQFGIKRDNILLTSIISKAFNSITNDEWQELNKKWLFDYTLLENKKIKTLNTKIEVSSTPEKKEEIKIDNETENITYPKKAKVLNLCVQNNLAPIEFRENGKLKGLSIDIIKHINKKLQFTLKYTYVNSFAQALEYIKEKKCDTILTAGNTFDTSNIIKSTTPIYSFDLAIITRKDIPIVSSLTSILNKEIAIKKESIFAKQIKTIYPNTPVIETLDDKESFKMITENKAYFTLSPHIIASYYLSKYAINDLYISRYTNIPYTINMAVHKNNQELLNTLNFHLDNIPEDVKENILTKWTKAPIKEAFDYSFMGNIFLVILFIISVIIYRQIILKKYNKKLQVKIDAEITKNELKTKQLIEQSKLAQMGELINMIAHQWRQPLASISAVTNNLLLKQHLQKKMSTKEHIEELTSIIDYSKYMSKTIDDFINLYQKDKIKEQTTLESIVETSLSIISTSFQKNRISINKDFMANIKILTYPSELNQVVLNLLKNSEDAFIRQKISSPKILISTYIDTDKIYLTIEDNAGGIKEENLKKVFEPYFSTKESKEGSGLGLYMSKTIVEDNCQGVLTALNTNDGIKFIIALPYSE